MLEGENRSIPSCLHNLVLDCLGPPKGRLVQGPLVVQGVFGAFCKTSTPRADQGVQLRNSAA